jgi:transposase
MAGLAQILAENTRLRTELMAREVANARLQDKLDVLQVHNDQVERALAQFKARLTAPRAERFVEGQTPLPFIRDIEVVPALHPVASDEDNAEKPAAKAKRKPKRRRPEDSPLPRRRVRCAVSDEATCRRCGGPLRVFGTTTSHRVNWVPGHFIVDEVERDKCSCPNCPSEGVLTAPEPYGLSRARCGDGLLAWVLVDKFSDHLPLHRQAKRMKREGFELATSTLSGWVAQGAELLGAVAKAVENDVLDGDFVQGDDTGFPVQDGADGALRKGRLWAFTNQEQVFYSFTPTKYGVHPEALLSRFRGDVLLTDGGSEFNAAVQSLKLERAGCWSHLRRYFFEARTEQPEEAGHALRMIRDLFLLERRVRGKPPDAVAHERQNFAKPLVTMFFSWVKTQSTFARPSSDFGKALGYAINQEAYMRCFLEHPTLPIHNNLSELMLRQPIVGRKKLAVRR